MKVMGYTIGPGAKLTDANLRRTHPSDARSLVGVILPDGRVHG
jgi:hypothetical protein